MQLNVTFPTLVGEATFSEFGTSSVPSCVTSTQSSVSPTVQDFAVDAVATGIERTKLTPSALADATGDSAITVPSERWALSFAEPKSRSTVL